VVPVHVVVFLDRPKMRVERGSADDLFNFGATYGSIFPAIEMMMLAARALGVGTAMTTMLTSREAETKALLGVPAEYQLIALIPMGYPDAAFKRPYRKPVFPRLHDGPYGIAHGQGQINQIARGQTNQKPSPTSSKRVARLEIPTGGHTDMEWPLPLWLVLREELAELRPPAAVRVETFAAVVEQSATSAGPRRIRQVFVFPRATCSNLDRLKTKMAERAPELAKLLTPREAGGHRDQNVRDGLRKLLAKKFALRISTIPRRSIVFSSLPTCTRLFPIWPSRNGSRNRIRRLCPKRTGRTESLFARPRRWPAPFIRTTRRFYPRSSTNCIARISPRYAFPAAESAARPFCLGVVQSLARVVLLDKFDYLSTVSGGGYLGGWLAAVDALEQRRPLRRNLRAEQRQCVEAGAGGTTPVFYLRNFSNYLTPQTGLFSADSWTLARSYLRNLLLNWTVLLPILMAIVAVPYILVAAMRIPWISIPIQSPHRTAKFVCFGLAVLSLAMAAFYEGVARPSRSARLEKCARSWPCIGADRTASRSTFWFP